MEITTRDKDSILKCKTPEDLFICDKDQIEVNFKRLRSIWHPDRNRDAQASIIFDHIGKLFNQIDLSRRWIPSYYGSYIFTNTSGKTFKIEYKKAETSIHGKMLHGMDNIYYIIEPDHYDLVDKYVKNWAFIKFPNAKDYDKLKVYIPDTPLVHKTHDSIVLVLPKRNDCYQLSHIAHYYNDAIQLEHIWWICSRLCNLNCLLEYNKIFMGDYSLESTFVSPKDHTLTSFGGWFFVTQLGTKISSITAESYETLEDRLKDNSNIARRLYSRLLLRQVIKKLLGNRWENVMERQKVVPKLITDWIMFPEKDSFKDFEKWDHVLNTLFKPRRFTKMELSGSDLYKGA